MESKAQRLKYFKFLAVVFSFAFLILNFSVVRAATLYFSPSSGNFSVGDILTTSVLVNTQSKAINNADAVINFPAGLLDVVSVNKSGSIFSLWVEEPAFSNSAGIISFNGGLPTPGFNGTAGRLINIVFRIKNAGSASLIFSSGAVRANDGYGTDILQTKAQAQFNLISEERPIAPPSALGAPQAPSISSPTHPDPNKWYSQNSATFNWPVPNGVNAARLLVGSAPIAEPVVLYVPAISKKTIDDLSDGVWYFHAQLRNSSGWGNTTHFRFQIDTTRPSRFDIELLPREDLTERIVKLNFDAQDELSGIDHYEIEIDDRAQEIWVDDGSGIYATSPLESGKHILIARAVDKAGNFLSNSATFTIEETPLLKYSYLAIDFLSVLIPLIALLALLLLIVWYSFYKRAQLKKRLKKEVQEAEGALHKAFDVLREDVKEQVKQLEKAKTKRDLTQEEDRIIQQLRKHMDSAEKFISKEVEDIEKEIKR
ncbi:MAG: cohesin domain-containing protein [bacterium]|nr:cohesin domain-containing protein [bacterium]